MTLSRKFVKPTCHFRSVMAFWPSGKSPLATSKHCKVGWFHMFFFQCFCYFVFSSLLFWSQRQTIETRPSGVYWSEALLLGDTDYLCISWLQRRWGLNWSISLHFFLRKTSDLHHLVWILKTSLTPKAKASELSWAGFQSCALQVWSSTLLARPWIGHRRRWRRHSICPKATLHASYIIRSQEINMLH